MRHRCAIAGGRICVCCLIIARGLGLHHMQQPGLSNGIYGFIHFFLHVFGNTDRRGKLPGGNGPPNPILRHDLLDPRDWDGPPSHPREPHLY